MISGLLHDSGQHLFFLSLILSAISLSFLVFVLCFFFVFNSKFKINLNIWFIIHSWTVNCELIHQFELLLLCQQNIMSKIVFIFVIIVIIIVYSIFSAQCSDQRAFISIYMHNLQFLRVWKISILSGWKIDKISI